MTSYWYEVRFLVLSILKDKYRSTLNMKKGMRVSVTTLLANYETLIRRKQAHCLQC